MSRYGHVNCGLSDSVKILRFVFFFFLTETIQVAELTILEGNGFVVLMVGRILTIVNTKTYKEQAFLANTSTCLYNAECLLKFICLG